MMTVPIIVTCRVGGGDILVMRGVRGCAGWGGGVLMYDSYEGTFFISEGHEGTFDGYLNFSRYEGGDKTTSTPLPDTLPKHNMGCPCHQCPKLHLHWCSVSIHTAQVDLGDLGESPFPPLRCGKVAWWQLGSMLVTQCLSVDKCPPLLLCPSCTRCPWCPC